MAAYKTSEKRWKHASGEDAHADAAMVDPRNLTPEQQARVRCVGSWKWRDDGSVDMERPVLAFDGFGDRHRGFCVIPNAIDTETQLQFAHSCLTEYTEAPHVTNMHLQSQSVAGIWRKARQAHPHDPAKSPLLAKLHWAAAGYHYDWTARKYHDGNFSPVPALLERLATRCAEACGMTLAAEAVIVNFYKPKSHMGGHQDDVEYTMDHPVVSLSLGSSCVFLKGGLTKDEPPLELLLRSGDIAVLGGKSRMSYHGVARVLPTPFAMPSDDNEALPREGGVREEYEAVRTYLATERININIRQVYPQESPGSDTGGVTRPTLLCSMAQASPLTPDTAASNEAVRLERRRKQCRVSQRRYRDKKGSTEYNLRLDVNSLRERVQALTGLRELLETKIWSSRLAQNAAVLKAVEQYFAVFEQGLHNPEAGGENVRRCFEMQAGFLRAFLAVDVQFGDARGVEEVLEQWHRYTQFHAWVETRFISAEVFGPDDSPIVVAQGTLTVQMSRSTIERVFPRVLNEPALVAALLDQVVEYPTSTTFAFNERAQVERLGSEVDFLAGISELLGSTIAASRVLLGAFIAEGSKLSANVGSDSQQWRRVLYGAGIGE
ncbi:hypothetical protein BBJ28_00012014 [Nothophytophthora sp. Chile5]|nr:hypothetical protein BBJ28_00012014 [Nothophytophthora sp. Chile5]